MTTGAGDFGASWWGKNLYEVDREVVRLATICDVRILDPGILDRIISNDASVCGTRNPAAFEKLRALVMMHYRIRDESVGAVGEQKTQEMIRSIVSRLHKLVGDKLGKPPAAA